MLRYRSLEIRQVDLADLADLELKLICDYLSGVQGKCTSDDSKLKEHTWWTLVTRLSIATRQEKIKCIIDRFLQNHLTPSHTESR